MLIFHVPRIGLKKLRTNFAQIINEYLYVDNNLHSTRRLPASADYYRIAVIQFLASSESSTRQMCKFSYSVSGAIVCPLHGQHHATRTLDKRTYLLARLLCRPFTKFALLSHNKRSRLDRRSCSKAGDDRILLRRRPLCYNRLIN